MKSRAWVAVVAASVALVALVTPVLGAGATTATVAVTKISARSLLFKLPVAAEAGAATYSRTKFKYPIDANRDCQNTRAEVLISETKAPVTFTTSAHCYVKTGKWYSYYDGVTVTVASGVQIDHLVPLEQAWVSGARSWTTSDRTRFANDLAYGPTLVAVTTHINESKGDRDPAHWLPPRAAARCTYATQWVEVKYRWRLAIDKLERTALGSLLSGSCGTHLVSLPPRGR